MSSWTALNVAYDGEWERPDAFLSEVTVRLHPHDDFDVLLDVFQQGERVTDHLFEMAAEGGDLACVVAVSGSDTSGRFTFTQLDETGEPIDTWGSPSHTEDGGFAEQPTHGNTIDQIEAEIGRRPDMGGNYRGYNKSE